VDIETDDGQHLSGEGVEKELLVDWDLDLEEHRRKADLESPACQCQEVAMSPACRRRILWTAQDFKLLRKLAGRTSVARIANRLKRTGSLCALRRT
jgi:hypothetical protein